jgi:hypothetical protein
LEDIIVREADVLAKGLVRGILEKAFAEAEEIVLKEEQYTLYKNNGDTERGTRRSIRIKPKKKSAKIQGIHDLEKALKNSR